MRRVVYSAIKAQGLLTQLSAVQAEIVARVIHKITVHWTWVAEPIAEQRRHSLSAYERNRHPCHCKSLDTYV